MTSLLKSDFLHRFVGGFVLGALALAATQPGPIVQQVIAQLAHVA